VSGNLAGKQAPQAGAPVHALRYVLATAARNEAAFIEATIKAVAAQTVRPLRWVIVSDGSTDGTDDIVRTYAAQHGWMELIRKRSDDSRSFASKAHAVNAAYERMRDLEYDVIGNLDADVTFEPGYFAYLLDRFAEAPRLGVGGTPFREGSFQYDYRFTSIEHVAGPCQLFRRACFEAIGGYTPSKGGGIDVIAVLTARMRGWQTRTFTDKFYTHHRTMGTAKASRLMARFRDGQKDYLLGAHPLWEVFRATYQMTQPPFAVGGCVLLSGYVWSMLRRTERPVSSEFVRFRRREQLLRLRRFIATRLPFRKAATNS
jgi:poly-beta-1,6-N-acetyl-D-glucosamine synthase